MLPPEEERVSEGEKVCLWRQAQRVGDGGLGGMLWQEDRVSESRRPWSRCIVTYLFSQLPKAACIHGLKTKKEQYSVHQGHNKDRSGQG